MFAINTAVQKTLFFRNSSILVCAFPVFFELIEDVISKDIILLVFLLIYSCITLRSECLECILFYGTCWSFLCDIVCECFPSIPCIFEVYSLASEYEVQYISVSSLNGLCNFGLIFHLLRLAYTGSSRLRSPVIYVSICPMFSHNC